MKLNKNDIELIMLMIYRTKHEKRIQAHEMMIHNNNDNLNHINKLLEDLDELEEKLNKIDTH